MVSKGPEQGSSRAIILVSTGRVGGWPMFHTGLTQVLQPGVGHSRNQNSWQRFDDVCTWARCDPTVKEKHDCYTTTDLSVCVWDSLQCWNMVCIEWVYVCLCMFEFLWTMCKHWQISEGSHTVPTLPTNLKKTMEHLHTNIRVPEVAKVMPKSNKSQNVEQMFYT